MVGIIIEKVDNHYYIICKCEYNKLSVMKSVIEECKAERDIREATVSEEEYKTLTLYTASAQEMLAELYNNSES